MGDTVTRRKVPWRPLTVIGACAALVAGMVAFTVNSAFAATLFSDNFEDGNSAGWSTSGGTWSVATDGSRVLRQSGTSSDARARAGSSSWTNYTVTARVKPTAFNGSSRFVAVLARAQSNTSYYYLALRSTNVVELKKLVGGSSTTLASASIPVTLNTFYTLSLSVSGTQLSGSVDGGTPLTATDSQFSAGGIGVATFFASASFDDVSVVDSAGGGGTSAPPTSQPPSSQPPSSPPPGGGGSNVADGWAGVDALGQNGTTGGAGGPTVTVSTAAEFISAAQRSGPLIVMVNGVITLSAMTDVTSDKTIVGVGANSGFTGFGLNIGLPIDDGITAPPANAVHNVILRNLKISNSADDDINVQMFSHHIWIDHNDLSTPHDGSLDIKRGSSYVTVSWNHSHDANKNMLLGHDDANAAQDTGWLKVTYHHNWFDATRQRNPRARFGNPVHVFNNYYNDNGDYGVAATIGSGVLVEGNYFENVDDPYHLAEGDSPGGSLVARNNCLVNTGEGETGGSVAAIPYAYRLDTACDVKAIVSGGAGTGKVGVPTG
jgi:pectate lyase